MSSSGVNNVLYDPRRDAWFVLRGFLYQIELTVLRWIELRDDAVIYCECGEDIDRVTRILESERFSEEHLLEQIKVRSSISLRSPEALTAICRFVDAASQNPLIRVLFQYSTTAFPMKEHGLKTPADMPGIQVWNAVGAGRLRDGEVEAYIESLRALVAGAACPAGLDALLFENFQNFMSREPTDTIIERLIVPFHWAVGQPKPAALKNQIASSVLALGWAGNDNDAAELTDLLTVTVLRRVSQEGEKRLTAADLRSFIASRSMSTRDRQVLERIHSLVGSMEAQLRELSPQVRTILERVEHIPEIAGGIDEIRERLGIERLPFTPIPLPPPDDPPMPPTFSSPRKTLVATIEKRLSAYVWIHVTGSTGMGKTFLAARIYESPSFAARAWVSIRGERTENDAVRTLEGHLLRLAKANDSSIVKQFLGGSISFGELTRRSATALGPGGLLVLDELPDLMTTPQLREKLLLLVSAFRDTAGKVVTTGQHVLPPTLLDRVPQNVTQIDIPLMDEETIDQVLVSARATATVRASTFLSLIHVVTKGHPELVVATVLFMRRKEWSLDPTQVRDLLSGEAGGDVREETLRKAVKLIPHNDARDLLYRLSLLSYPFDLSLVRTVARLSPVIARPVEQLDLLVGPWISKLPDGKCEVSPLLANAGARVLDASQQAQTHVSAAFHFLKEGNIDQTTAFRIFLHFSAAKDWANLATFVLRLAFKLKEPIHAKHFEIVAATFTSFPDTMKVSERIAVRAFQVRVRDLLGEDSDAYVREIEEMVAPLSATNDMKILGVLASLVLLGPLRLADEPVRMAKFALLASRLSSKVLPPIRERAQDVLSLEFLLVPALAKARSPVHIRGVVEILRELTAEERRLATTSSHAIEAIQLLCDNCFLSESTKPPEEQNWEGIIRLLDDLSSFGFEAGAGAFRTPPLRTKALVLAEKLGRPEEAIRVLDSGFEHADDNGKFLLDYTGGCILLDQEAKALALERLVRAIALRETPYRYYYFDCFRRSAEAAGRLGDWESARSFTLGARGVLAQHQHPFEHLEMIGEGALIEWMVGNRRKAWSAMLGIVVFLDRRRDFEDPRFREVFRKTGHVLGWMSSMASTGHPPLLTGQGEEYVAPYPGLFSLPRAQLAELAFPRVTAALFMQLGYFAAGCEWDDLAETAFRHAVRAAEHLHLDILAKTAKYRLADLVAARREYRKAVEYAIEGVAGMAASDALARQGKSSLECVDPTESVLLTLSKDQRLTAERVVLWISVGPIMTQLLADGALPSAYESALTEMESSFVSRTSMLVEPGRWLAMLSSLRQAFSQTATRESIRGQFSAVPIEDPSLIGLLYLAFSQASDALLVEACKAQLEAFDFLLGTLPASKRMALSVSVFLARYWQRAVEEQPFAVSNPAYFRAQLAEMETASIRSGARVMKLACDAVGVSVTRDRLARLRAVSLPS